MSKLDGVISVHPHGDTGLVEIALAKKDSLSSKQVAKSLEDTKFSLEEFKVTGVAAKPAKKSN